MYEIDPNADIDRNTTIVITVEEPIVLKCSLEHLKVVGVTTTIPKVTCGCTSLSNYHYEYRKPYEGDPECIVIFHGDIWNALVHAL